jgi:acyl-CoA synthetase (AMP-forming)/AMP-acid ligase II
MSIVNVAARMTEMARQFPEQTAVVMPRGVYFNGRRLYRTMTFADLDRESDRMARGLRRMGVKQGTRLALMVPPSLNFVTLVFALFKAGAVSILIDPGMGKKNLLRCLDEAKPQGFVAISIVQAVRTLLSRRYKAAKYNVTVGPRWFWGGMTLERLRAGGPCPPELAPTKSDDPAAIIFTTGSTGPPKPVLYTHGNFDRQVTEIRDQYGIAPGGIDLAGFPLFGLFNAAMGVTTVIPDMNPTRPAKVNPARIVEAVTDWKVTQSFGSPAIWNRVGPWCVERNIQLTTLKRVFSAGAPVPPSVMQTMTLCLPTDAQMHTPYGATEALPVSTIEASEVLGETKHAWRRGCGTCVGRHFAGIEWRVIRITDEPIPTIDLAEGLPEKEIGELIVRGPVVTRYFERDDANRLAKIADGDAFWHRMGDVGYLDSQGRFWFCGRKAHRVETAERTYYSDPVEGVMNQQAPVFRSALVGVGLRGAQRPVVVLEFERGAAKTITAELHKDLLELAQGHDATRGIVDFRVHPGQFPVDIRHNAKIFREKLAVWAEAQLALSPR